MAYPFGRSYNEDEVDEIEEYKKRRDFWIVEQARKKEEETKEEN